MRRRKQSDTPAYGVLRHEDAADLLASPPGNHGMWFYGEYRQRHTSSLKRILGQYLEIFDVEVFGDSAWNVDHRPAQANVGEQIFCGAILSVIQLWIGIVAWRVAAETGSSLLGVLAAIPLLVAFNVRWNAFEGSRAWWLASGVGFAGLLSSLLVAWFYWWPLSHGTSAALEAILPGYASHLYLIGWFTTGVLNIRFTRRMFGNPGVGGGTAGRELLAFLAGPILSAGAVAFLAFGIPFEFLFKDLPNWYEKRKAQRQATAELT